MTVPLDHVILPTIDQAASTAVVATMLGPPKALTVGHFICSPLVGEIHIHEFMSLDGVIDEPT